MRDVRPKLTGTNNVLKANTSISIKLGKARASKIQLVLVLHLISWERTNHMA